MPTQLFSRAAWLAALFAAACFAEEPVLRAPEGFVVEKAGDAKFPMFACFDERGRLFVTESSGGDLYLELQKQVRQCKVRCFEDKDGDGRFETSTIFAEGLTPSMGLVWRGGKLYAADPPELITLEDTDGDGKADKRAVILKSFGHQDNGSLHGLIFGPDGLLYMTTGRPDGYKLPRGDGTILEGMSGALIRCNPDGSNPEVVARGFENLVEVAFLANGDIIGSCNWYQRPIGGFRDALVHLIPGALFPYTPDKGSPLPFTGEVLPAVEHFPAVAVSGLMRYRGAAFPEAMRGNLFCAQHNSRKVSRHVLARSGSTYTAESFDFVTSDSPDFHPSDVLEAGDGSLLVIDTGAWYVQHCPTGKIRNSRAPGGIYRVRPAKAPTEIDQLFAQVNALHERMHWDFWNHGELGERYSPKKANLLSALDGGPRTVSAAHILARVGNPDAAPKLNPLLNHDAPEIRLAAAEALAACWGEGSLKAVWKGLTQQPDRHLEHALIHAAYWNATAKELEEALNDAHPRVQRAALILLDQPAPRGREPRPALTPDAVLARATAADPELRRTALRILQGHKAWASRAVALLDGWIKKAELSDEERAGLETSIAAFQSDAALRQVVADGLRGEIPAERKALLLAAMGQTSLAQFPAAWKEALAGILGGAASPARREAVRAAAALQVAGLEDALARIAADAQSAPGERVEALRALVAQRPKLPAAAVDFLVERLANRDDALLRLAAAETLRRAHLNDAQLLAALRALAGDALIPPDALLPALRECAGADSAKELAGALAELMKKGWRPAPEALEAALSRFPPDPATRAEADKLREMPRRGAEEDLAKIKRFEPLLSGGDAARGRAVFFGKKAACAACHAIGSEGGRIGPDLTKVGAVRSGRDLLESLLVPSSTFAQGYEPYVVAVKDGETRTGLLARQTEDTFVLRDSSGGESLIRWSQVKKIGRGQVSIMPEGLERALSEKEFQDLMAFLQALK